METNAVNDIRRYFDLLRRCGRGDGLLMALLLLLCEDV